MEISTTAVDMKHDEALYMETDRLVLHHGIYKATAKKLSE